jgi:hypothetical protein
MEIEGQKKKNLKFSKYKLCFKAILGIISFQVATIYGYGKFSNV